MSLTISPYRKPPVGAILNRAHPLANGLVGAWLFNEGQADRAFDLSGYANHGTLTNMDPATDWVQGPHGPALDFGGESSGDDVLVPHNSVLAITNNFTLIVWVFPRSSVVWGNTLIEKGVSNTNRYFFQYKNNNALSFEKNTLAWVTTNTVTVGQLNQCVVVNGPVGLKLYIDTVQGASASQVTLDTNTDNFSIGKTISGGSGIIDGKIDSVFVYSRALTPDQISQLYHEPFAMFKAYSPARYFSIAGGAQAYSELSLLNNWISSVSLIDSEAAKDLFVSSNWLSSVTRIDKVARKELGLPSNWISGLSRQDRHAQWEQLLSAMTATFSIADIRAGKDISLLSAWSSALTAQDRATFQSLTKSTAWVSAFSIWDAITSAAFESLLSTWTSAITIQDRMAHAETMAEAWAWSSAISDKAAAREHILSSPWVSASAAVSSFAAKELAIAGAWSSSAAAKDTAGFIEERGSQWTAALSAVDKASFLQSAILSAWTSAVTNISRQAQKDLAIASTWTWMTSGMDGRRYTETLTSSWSATLTAAVKAAMRDSRVLSISSVLTVRDTQAAIDRLASAWVSAVAAAIVLTRALAAPDDWYNLLETQLVKTLQADLTVGTAGTLVTTIEAELRRDIRSYYDHELPAIGVKVTGSRRVLDATSGHFDKFFSYVCQVINRAGDLDEGVNTVQEILSAAENVIEAQYQPGSDLHGLGTHGKVRGGPIVSLISTDIGFRLFSQLEAEIVAIIEGEIEIITA